MTATLQFDDTSIFEGFTVNYKLNDNMSKTLLIAESFRRVENVLESLNLNKLKHVLKDQCFVIHDSLGNVQDGDVLFISSLKSKKSLDDIMDTE
jgi:hypothetical protein